MNELREDLSIGSSSLGQSLDYSSFSKENGEYRRIRAHPTEKNFRMNR
jgi:hypothetical protein